MAILNDPNPSGAFAKKQPLVRREHDRPGRLEIRSDNLYPVRSGEMAFGWDWVIRLCCRCAAEKETGRQEPTEATGKDMSETE